MGGSKGKQTYTPPPIDNSAALRAEEEARQADEKKRLMKMADEDRKRNIAASGRKSTILAGEGVEPKTLLGG